MGEAELVRRLRGGDEEAFSELVRCHGEGVLAATRRILGSDEALDAAAAALIEAAREIGEIGGLGEERPLAPWLRRIALRSALARWRERRNGAGAGVERLLPRFREDGTWETAPGGFRAAEARRRLPAAVRALPDTHRIVYVLCDLERWSAAETAAAVGIPPARVRARLHEARRALVTASRAAGTAPPD